MFKKSFRTILCAGLIVAALAASGCGKVRPPADRAEKVVEQFLDAWSRGEPPDKFADAGGPIQGTDPDWKAGSRLRSFLSSDSKPAPDAPDHVRCRFSLSLQDKSGKRLEKEVLYDVQLGERIVIRRVLP